jgi:elongator complex protein 3
MSHLTSVDLISHKPALIAILQAVAADPALSRRAYNRLLNQHPKDGRGLFGADELVAAYRALAGTDGLPPFDAAVLNRLRLKPSRTASGVTPVTVFTKPYPCPGECIFCPNDVRMPKSYLRNEPGAQRAEANAFDPYLQTMLRLQALDNMGHPTDKIELIILGGTWSFYPETYQLWFIKRVFDAMHDFGRGADESPALRTALETGSPFGAPSPGPIPLGPGQSYNQAVQAYFGQDADQARQTANDVAAGLRERTALTEFATWGEVEAAHLENASAPCRCVGLVVETRPDYATPAEVLRLRRLGCTKVQLGFQSLDDRILTLNKRGHNVGTTRRAVNLFRRAGFKIHAHWMPNLLGATPATDRDEFVRLFSDPALCPDELKIYPCSLVETAELMSNYERGEWAPYSTATLTDLLVDCLAATPEYCRLTRVIRDIPGTDIVVGNKVTNLRQEAELVLARRGGKARDIRAREIRNTAVDARLLTIDEQTYPVAVGQEVFLQFITEARQIAAFLRLLLPDADAPTLTRELEGAAIVREVHVYGPQLRIGETDEHRPQHSGLGTRLLERAGQIAASQGYPKLAVISAVGTRGYYRARGFTDGTLYQIRRLDPG